MSDRPSYLMDYGPDWPPTISDRETVPPRPEPPLRLWQKLALTVAIFGFAWASGALVLRAIDPQPHPAPGTVVWHDPPGTATGVTTLPPRRH